MKLIQRLIKQGVLKTPVIIEAFKNIKRSDFLPEYMLNMEELDEALPIGHGQTISQPYVVAFMLELLQPKKGEKILDVGYGSGWTSALLAYIVGSGGKIVSLEIIPEIKEFGEKNIAKYGFVENGIVECILGDGAKGWKGKSPYDNILVSASGKELQQAWIDQLKIDGRIVAPIETSIWRFTKTDKNNLKQEEFPGFIFVPLVKDND